MNSDILHANYKPRWYSHYRFEALLTYLLPASAAVLSASLVTWLLRR